MDMIIHQHIGMNSQLEALGAFTQPLQKSRVIGWIAEDCLFVMPPLDDVMHLIGDNQTGQTGHDNTRIGEDELL